MLKRAIWMLVGVFSLGIGSGLALAEGNHDNDNSLSAFIASPLFGRVGPQAQSTIAAGPIFAPRVGLVCQTMTQTIDIDGQSVHASALLCRQPDGTWQISPSQNARGATPTRRLVPSSRGSAIATVE
jgi:surface antigen